ncbi:MAG TPA: HIT family protein [Patescibacteria group bacterium]|jgi:histidine triad (HIT) family protein|nr:HIT family protein [Patescibacteria group bacterium]
MIEPSIFTRIINGEIPAHKVYEDDKTLAFLDIHPAQPGHTLVIPKVQVDRLEDLNEDDYLALMSSVKKIMQRVVEIFGSEYRACLKLEGFDVPHAHVHVIPCLEARDFWAKQRMDVEPDHDALAGIAERLAF